MGGQSNRDLRGARCAAQRSSLSRASYQQRRHYLLGSVRSSSKWNRGVKRAPTLPVLWTQFSSACSEIRWRRLLQEAGWDSPKPGYDGLIDIANYLFKKSKDRTDAEASSVRILRSLFPPFLLPLFKALVAPLFGGKPAAVLTARVTQATCQWLMGSCSVNTVELPDGSSLESGVLVERCKYLEESKCAGICIHTCKIPSQTFITDYMGVPLTMEPNLEDFSCQFKFGVEAPVRADDESLKTPCLEVCPMALARFNSTKTNGSEQCPQVA